MKFCLPLLPVLGFLASCSSEPPASTPANLPKSEVVRTDAPGIVGTATAASAAKATGLLPPPAPAGAGTSTFQLLQGRWQSTQDSNSVIVLQGHRYIDYYEGVSLDTTAFVLARGCPTEPGAEQTGDNERFLVQPDEGLCWEIVGVDKKSLELSYTGRGNTLNYRRLQ